MIPLLKGGQGRSASDVAESASWVGWCLVLALALAAALAVGGAA